MCYAIIALLDKQFQQNIRKIWQELNEKGLSDYAYEVENREPHVTLASLEEGAVNSLLQAFRDMGRDYSPIPMHFDSIGSFLGENIVTLNPVKTPELTAFHLNLHQKLRGYVSDSSNYNPEHWIPHITLANRIETNRLPLVYSYCLQHCSLISGSITGMKLIQITDTGQVTDVSEISFS